MAEISQTDFVKALLDPNLPTPEGLIGPDGATSPKRFAVYRNNVAVSLTDALKSAFPVIHKLVGEEFFAAMAGVYLRLHPPKTPVMMFYGEEMPTFLERFEPVKHLPYLPDIARVELAMRQAYHAADAKPIDPSALESANLMSLHVTLAPPVQILRSRFPIFGIWQANMIDGAPQPNSKAEAMIIMRPEFDPIQRLLPPGAATFLLALSKGSFGYAFSQATSAVPSFDLAKTLGILLSGGAITQLTEDPTK
ncbi:MAG: DNA-binding domain-containing protein [Pseudomonadota bacterium]